MLLCPLQVVFARADCVCGYTIPATIVPTLFWGAPRYSFLCLGTISSVYVSFCLCFPLIVFPSMHVFIHLGFWWFFCLFCFVWCGLFWECMYFLWFVLLFLSPNILIFYFYFPYSFCTPSFFSPSLFLVYVPCSLSIYFSYIFALKRPPKVALPWYSLPGLPWNETVFSLCSEVCGSNTLSFAHLMGWEPLYPQQTISPLSIMLLCDLLRSLTLDVVKENDSIY